MEINTVLRQIRAARLQKGLKQAELGEKLGLPQSRISQIEQGVTDPRLSTVMDMARLLDLELVLVARPLLPALRAFLYGEGEEERRFQPDADDGKDNGA